MTRMRPRAPYWNERQRRYHHTTNRLGTALLLSIALHLGLDLLFSPALTRIIPYLNDAAAAILQETVDMLTRVIAFLLPALFYRLITPYHERVALPLAPRAPRRLGLIIPAALAIIYCAATTNAFLMRLLGLSASTPSYALPDAAMPPYVAVLSFMATAVVPAFCEEFLFRGLVMSQLLPYGKTTAVLGSAVLFGLIHQNYGQFFYATVAGVVLALVVIESGSVWGGVLIHLFNNMLSVIGEVLRNRLPYESEMVLYRAIEVAVIGVGLICLIVLLYRRDGRSSRAASCEALRVGEDMERGALRGFFSPMMSAFMALCIFEMILLAAVPLLATWGWRML